MGDHSKGYYFCHSEEDKLLQILDGSASTSFVEELKQSMGLAVVPNRSFLGDVCESSLAQDPSKLMDKASPKARRAHTGLSTRVTKIFGTTQRPAMSSWKTRTEKSQRSLSFHNGRSVTKPEDSSIMRPRR